jgi:hypothetical protein
MTAIWQGGGSDSIAGERLGPFLGPNERLIWVGRPKAGVILQSTDLLQIPFGLFFLAFALFWEFLALSSSRGAPTFFAFWGLPFIAVGLYVAIGRFFYDSLRRSRTFYGLTNQRVLILRACESMRDMREFRGKQLVMRLRGGA